MTDKFPEAFNRFCKVVNVKKIKDWKQLRLAFGSWAGRKWLPTGKQLDGLAIQARRLGIPTKHLTREEQINRVFWKATIFQQQQKEVRREKRFSNSYVNFQIWLEKSTRTTRYQQRVINYIRTHPNATLAEARGHRNKKP